MKRKLMIAAASAVLATAGAGAAWAAMASGTAPSEDRSDAAALSQAKISLGQAAAVAERHAGGRAVEAALEAEGDAVVYEVAVLTGSTEHEVTVDARSGAVTKMTGGDAEDGDEGSERGVDRD
ncbi:PepSY domain-containing protein [Phenylobacterium sp.]|uniref:PepSY domain-containing protein n=1 Tax=Phenylobacterium sp. TaxID=1871053 RepID=UPI0025E4FC12|nr:PepSY domain-containing protein [Phenylobacterium sp.]